MITIEPRLAQEIVTRTMKIIAVSVNVMNTHGVIIGSGEPARIGDLHAGAQLAIAQRRTVEIDSAATRKLPGVKPGVNLPLSVRGQICGVVGLSGEPDAVRQFGELVRVTAEMILEQAQLIGELQREKGYREEFVYQLGRHAARRPRSLGGAPGHRFSRRACRRRARSGRSRTAPRSGAERAAPLPEPSGRAPAGDPDGGRVTARAGHPTELRPGRQQSVAARAGAPARERDRGVAARRPGTAVGVALSYQSAHRTLRAGRRRNPRGTAFSYYELSLPVLLAGVDAGW